MKIVQSWDTAAKVGDETDFSVCTTWMVIDEDCYLLDVYRDRLEYPALKRKAIELYRHHHATSVLIEDKSSGTQLIQDLRWERQNFVPIRIEPEGDKANRMATQAPHIEAGRVFLPQAASWLDDYMNELLAFPYGRYADQVDSTSQLISWVRKRRLRGISFEKVRI